MLDFNDSLVYQEDLHYDQAHLVELFSPIVGNAPHEGSFPYTVVFTLMRDNVGWDAHTPDQQF